MGAGKTWSDEARRFGYVIVVVVKYVRLAMGVLINIKLRTMVRLELIQA